jgi:hypothetical protein
MSIDGGFTSRSRIFHSHGDVTITCEGLQNLGLCSSLRAFWAESYFIEAHLRWHGTSVFPVSPEGPTHLLPLSTRKGMLRIYSNLDPHVSPFSRLIRHARGCYKVKVFTNNRILRVTVWIVSLFWSTRAIFQQSGCCHPVTMVTGLQNHTYA